MGARRWASRLWGLPLRSYLVAVLVLFVATAGAGIWSAWAQAEHEALRAGRADAAFAARKAAELTGEMLTAVRGSVDSVASNPAAPGVFADPAPCRLSFSLGIAGGAGHLDVLRADGTVICSSTPADAAQAVAYREAPWLVDARQPGRPAARVIGPVTDARTGRPAVVLAAPVAELGVVAAFVDLVALGAATDALLGGARHLEFVMVAEGGGTVLTRWPDGVRWSGTPVRASRFAVSGGTGDGVDVTGLRRLYGVSRVDGVGWQVYAGADRAAAVAAARRAAGRQALVAGAGLLAGLLATLLVQRRITRPIGALRAGVRAARVSGDLDRTVPVAGPREVAELGGEFNRLLSDIGRELREREDLERRLRQSERLESLGHLAAGIAHDFNNLLAVINGYAGLAAADVAEAAAERPQWQALHADLVEIVAAGDRATALTRQLLAFARADPAPETRVLDLNAVVTGIETLLRRTLGAGVTLVTELAPEPWRIRADPGRLEQVLVNLAVNARDAMPDGGTLTVDTGRVAVDEHYAAQHPGLWPGRYMRLRVADTGTGMDKATLDRAFEPFFTTKPKGQGTGLGLATIYGIITQAGGHAQIYSEVGQGTTVTALLPATDAEAAADEAAAEAVPRGSGETVLLVEDDDSLRALTERILQREGYAVLSAAGPADAHRLAAAHARIDLLLTDVVLPRTRGPALADALRADHAGLRVLYTSGYTATVLADRDVLPLDATVLTKPVSAHELLTAVRRVLDAPDRVPAGPR